MKFGRNISKIGGYAFRNAYCIGDVTFPGKSITTTSSNTFAYGVYLTGVTFTEGFNISSGGTYMFTNCGLKNVKLPNSLTKVPDYMFNSCTSLTGLTIGTGVTSIGMSSFAYHKINNLVIPDNVTGVTTSAFRNTASTVFNSVKIGNGCTSIGSSAFTYNFENIDIGSGITSIGNYGIYNQKCKKLICRATTPPSCGTSAFGSWSSDGVNYPQIYVPDGSVNAYKSANFWSTHSAKIHPLSDLN